VLPKSLISIFKNDSWVKVGVGVELDLNYLSSNYNLGHCSGAIEIKNLALLAKYEKSNLEYMFNKVIGGHVKKISSICDWSKDTLTHEQLVYAARDAIMSLQLFKGIMTPSINYLIKLHEEHKNKVEDVLKVDIINMDIGMVDQKDCFPDDLKGYFPDDPKATTLSALSHKGYFPVDPIIPQTPNNTNTRYYTPKRKNYVGDLNELAQRERLKPPTYYQTELSDPMSTTKEKRVFETVCEFEGYVARGYGASFKDSKASAAQKMYEMLQ
jgi:hypothetical protein